MRYIHDDIDIDIINFGVSVLLSVHNSATIIATANHQMNLTWINELEKSLCIKDFN